MASFAGIFASTELAYITEALTSLGTSDTMLLTGPAGCGKTHLLRHYADIKGLIYIQVDCLEHF
jgi:MoxR-like ATPase